MSTTPSGTIATSDVRTALNVAKDAVGTTNYPTNTISFNDSLVRVLSGKTTAGSAISMNDMRNKAGPNAYGTAADAGACGVSGQVSTTFTQNFHNGTYGTYRVDTPNSISCEANPRSFVQFYSFIMNNYVISGYPQGGYIHKYIKVDKDTFTATDAGNLADLGNYGSPNFPVTGYGDGAGRSPWLSIPGSNTGLIFGADSYSSGKTFLIRITPTGTSITTIKTGGASDGTVYPYAGGYGPAGYIYSTARALSLGGQRYVNISPDLSTWTTTQVSYLLFNYVGTPNAYTAMAQPVGGSWILQSSTNGTSWTTRYNLPTSPGGRTGGVSGAYGAGTIVYAQCFSDSSNVNFYRSMDDGVTWQTYVINLPSTPNGNMESPRIVYAGNGIFVLIVSAVSSVLDYYVCRSTPGSNGYYWFYTKYTNFVTGAAYAGNYEMFSSTGGNVVFVAGGSFKQSTDFGETWTTKTIPQTFTPGNYKVSTIFPIF